MPGLDRTGPGGQGSQTGKRFGKCKSNNMATDNLVTTGEAPFRAHRNARQGMAQGMGVHKGQGGRHGQCRRSGNNNA